jgi:hypothetical protein
MSNAARRIDDDSSPRAGDSQVTARGSAVRRAAAAVVLAGAVATLAATVLPVLRITVAGRIQPALDRTGWDLHGPALIGLGILVVLLLPAAVRGSLAASVGIAAAGVVILVIAGLADLPDVGDTGRVGPPLAPGAGRSGAGAYAEALAGVLLLAGGGVLTLTRPRD